MNTVRAARRIGVAVAVLAVVAVAVVGLVLAARPGHAPTMRERVDAVAATVKCPTCGGLSVKDSTSVLAAGARTQIEQQLEQGRTPDQIRQYFVDRYGQQVLLDPGTGGPGLLVWLLPGLGVVAAGLLAWRWTGRRRAALPEGEDAAATALAEYRAGRLAVVAAAAVAGVVLTGSHGTGTPVAAASTAAASAPAPAPAAMPSPPPGYSGGMPQTAEQWVGLGKAYDKDHQYQQAVAAYDMALKLQPGADAVTLMRADVLVRSGQSAQALPDLQQLATRYPDNPDVLLILGLAQHGTGSPDFVPTLRHFLQLAPDSPAAPGVRTLLGKR